MDTVDCPPVAAESDWDPVVDAFDLTRVAFCAAFGMDLGDWGTGFGDLGLLRRALESLGPAVAACVAVVLVGVVAELRVAQPLVVRSSILPASALERTREESAAGVTALDGALAPAQPCNI